MNDFTKEELQELLDYCNWEPPALGMSEFRENLWLKIKSLIDNYERDQKTKDALNYIVNKAREWKVDL